MSTLLTTSSQRDDQGYPALVPILAGIFGGLGFICICGLIWCIVRRRKHRAPIIPYSLKTFRIRRQPPLEGGTVVLDSTEASRTTSKPQRLGTHGRGVGYGFNPIFKEPYGGGGGAESGKGPVIAERAHALYG